MILTTYGWCFKGNLQRARLANTCAKRTLSALFLKSGYRNAISTTGRARTYVFTGGDNNQAHIAILGGPEHLPPMRFPRAAIGIALTIYY